MLLAILLAAGTAFAAPAPVLAVWSATLTLGSTGVGDGSGHITSDDGWIDCTYTAGVQSGICAKTYSNVADFVSEFTVTLTLSPATGSMACRYKSADCDASGADVTISNTLTRPGGNVVVFPGFVIRTFEIDIGATVGGLTCLAAYLGGAATCYGFPSHVTVPYGTSLEFTATPYDGYTFDQWSSGPCSGRPAVCGFNVTAAGNVTPYFIVTPTPPPPTPSPTPKASLKPTARPSAAATAGPSASVAATGAQPTPVQSGVVQPSVSAQPAPSGAEGSGEPPSGPGDGAASAGPSDAPTGPVGQSGDSLGTVFVAFVGGALLVLLLVLVFLAGRATRRPSR